MEAAWRSGLHRKQSQSALRESGQPNVSQADKLALISKEGPMNPKQSAFPWNVAVTILIFTLISSSIARAQTFKVLHNFGGRASTFADGATPEGG